MSQSELKLVWVNTSMAEPAKDTKKGKPNNQSGTSDAPQATATLSHILKILGIVSSGASIWVSLFGSASFTAVSVLKASCLLKN